MSNFLSRALARWAPLFTFSGSQKYWKERYRLGGDSGAGSSGMAATYKAGVLNSFVERHAVQSVIEFGCGDGRQLELAKYPSYLGIDISPDAIRMCRERFGATSFGEFKVLDDYRGERADLAISLDVVYHLVEDSVYDDYLRRLFDAGTRFVIIYSSDHAGSVGTFRHVRHRPVTGDVAARFPDFVRMEEDSMLPPPVEHYRGLFTEFFFYQRRAAEATR